MKKPREAHKPKKRKSSFKAPPSKKTKAKYVRLNVLPDDLWLKVRRGSTVWEALQRADVELEGDCGGMGKCGKCKVQVLSSIGAPSPEAKALLDQEELRRGVRLACRTRINKDLVIRVGETDPAMEYVQILKTGYLPLLELDPLVDKRIVQLPPHLSYDGTSDLDRIKKVLGGEYRELVASFHCLRNLPGMLKATECHGAAVLHRNRLLAWQNWDQVGRRYGLVFDLGTSTLVGKLISLLDGRELAAISLVNSQAKYGSDVISRLQYVEDHAGGLQRLHKLMVRDLNRIIRRLLEVEGLEPDDIFIAVAAGNTTMQHLLVGLDPSGIARAPFAPVVTDGLVIKGAETGLLLHPEALLYVMPCKSGYIGGDMVGVILASGVADQRDRVILGLDLGTNGEIFLGNGKRLLTCSAAAGPALEGARIAHGMIARAGAIEGVRIDEDGLHYQIIGNIKPKGICGSGLVDLTAVLLHAGAIDSEGLILPSDNHSGDSVRMRAVENQGVWDFLIASPEESYDRRPVRLTQKDIRELQLAKGAIAAGIQTLMDELSIGVTDIDEIHLAGALGNYVHPYSAMRLGLIPRVDPERIRSLGNAASTGASMVLLSRSHWEWANRVSRFIEHVELSSRRDFNDYFVEQLNFPAENLW